MAALKTRFVSTKQDWETPARLFAALDGEFHFEMDLAADALNTKCPRYLSAEQNALQEDWNGVCWLNPPYGQGQQRLSLWVRKAYEEARKPSCTVVALLPARTNTEWWHRYCMCASEIRFIRGRPKFGQAKYGLPQPLAVVVFRSDSGDPVRCSSQDLP